MRAMRMPVVPILSIVLLMAVFGPAPAVAAFGFSSGPKANLWQRWTAHDPNSTTTIDHGVWDRILKRYIKPGPEGLNRFTYAAVSPEAKKAISNYIDTLAKIRISKHSRPQQFAYWVNLYNALTIRVVLDRYPVKSIRDIDISPGLFANGPWGKKLVRVEGHNLSLDDIEHRILRPIWRDPRIHYVVNCASYSCPNLRRSAFSGGNLERQLDAAARDYINSPRAVRFRNGKVIVSSLYAWYGRDFGGSEANIIEHLARYARGALKGRLMALKSIDAHAYNWMLNE